MQRLRFMLKCFPENRQKAKLLFFTLLKVQQAEQTRIHLSAIINRFRR
jgi:hypothetical protein